MAQYAVVTGADRGLGFALTRQLVNRGYTVFAGQYLSDWHELEQLPAEMREKVIVLELDVSNEASVTGSTRRSGITPVQR